MTDLVVLDAPGTLWLAADMHLGAGTPGTGAAFIRFLSQASDHADALFLVGDIFDAWLGDDMAIEHPPSWLAPIIEALKLTSQRLPLYLGRGNRDFLMGEPLMQHIGARLLPECVQLNTDIGPILLSHGDEYCTDDKSYQRFRRLVRWPALQRWYLNRPRSWRQKIAEWARRRSRQSNQHKPDLLMDVSPAAIHTAFHAWDGTLMVHGHTHRPAIHDLNIDGRARRRIVLPDWYVENHAPIRGGWLCVDQAGATLHFLPGADSRCCR